MKDPHVVSLHYELVVPVNIEFIAPSPVVVQRQEFACRLSMDGLLVEMGYHCADESAARGIVDPYLRAWELYAEVQYCSPILRFGFLRAEMIDRDPRRSHSISGAVECAMACSARIVGHVSAFPEPSNRCVYSPDVRAIWERYQDYRAGREKLASMAYFALTRIEQCAGGRKDASRKYSISRGLLDRLAILSSKVGGDKSVRKNSASSSGVPHTEEEVAWIESCIRRVAHQVAMHDADPLRPLPLLTASDLI